MSHYFIAKYFIITQGMRWAIAVTLQAGVWITFSEGAGAEASAADLFPRRGSDECSVPFSKKEREREIDLHTFLLGGAREDEVQHTFCKRMLMYMPRNTSFSKEVG